MKPICVHDIDNFFQLQFYQFRLFCATVASDLDQDFLCVIMAVPLDKPVITYVNQSSSSEKLKSKGSFTIEAILAKRRYRQPESRQGDIGKRAENATGPDC